MYLFETVQHYFLFEVWETEKYQHCFICTLKMYTRLCNRTASIQNHPIRNLNALLKQCNFGTSTETMLVGGC